MAIYGHASKLTQFGNDFFLQVQVTGDVNECALSIRPLLLESKRTRDMNKIV